MTQSKYRALASLLAIGLILSPFQNCTSKGSSQNETEQKSAPKYGGDGVDGKTYVHLGVCNAELSVDTRIFVSSDLKIAYVVRENCAETPLPYANRIEDVRVADGASAMIVFEPLNMVMDMESSSRSQPTTALYSCQSTLDSQSLSVTVWQDAGGIYGQSIQLSTRKDTGTIALTKIAADQYAGQSGSASMDFTSLSRSAAVVSLTFLDGSPGGGDLSCTASGANSRTAIPLTKNIVGSVVGPPGIVQQPECGEIEHTSGHRDFVLNWTAGSGIGACEVQYYQSGAWRVVASVSCDQNSNANSATYYLPANGIQYWLGNTLAIRLVSAVDQKVMCDFGKISCVPRGTSLVSTPDIDEDCDGHWDNRSTSGGYR